VLGSLVLASVLISCSGGSTSQPGNQTSPEKPQIASANVVKVTPTEVVIEKGGSSEGVVRLNIDKGYHVNANPPTLSYLKATELEIPVTQDLSVGYVTYPSGITKKFGFAEEPLAVYENEVVIKALLKASKSAKTGLQNLSGKVRVQACDDQVCYAPGVIDFAIPVNVK
jgi:thiol:disulfide interchange protein DsbD